MKSTLKDRELWFDGTNLVDPKLVPELLLSGVPIEQIAVTNIDEDAEIFNRISDFQLLTSKTENCPFDHSWNIPKEYLDLNLNAYIMKQLTVCMPDELKRAEYMRRAKEELDEIERRDIQTLFKALIYIVDKLKKSKTVWGVGRGSSCASLVLFIIGLHKVDPVKYSIPMTEFFHD